jgi:hypothetical protein
MPVAVNVNVTESEVASLSASDLAANLKGIDVTMANSAEELEAAITTSRTGRSYWKYFMIAALILLTVESLFADRLHKGKTAKGRQTEPLAETFNGVKDV